MKKTITIEYETTEDKTTINKIEVDGQYILTELLGIMEMSKHIILSENWRKKQ